ncbi:hypothetical protein LZ31DRAFT_105894 [Colletotrichum somersetense]|nr:hypothetical protein LZ31DRAFT_105894 [Colletotrichum somersetense]
MIEMCSCRPRVRYLFSSAQATALLGSPGANASARVLPSSKSSYRHRFARVNTSKSIRTVCLPLLNGPLPRRKADRLTRHPWDQVTISRLTDATKREMHIPSRGPGCDTVTIDPTHGAAGWFLPQPHPTVSAFVLAPYDTSR